MILLFSIFIFFFTFVYDFVYFCIINRWLGHTTTIFLIIKNDMFLHLYSKYIIF